jgi:hypothetical protein
VLVKPLGFFKVAQLGSQRLVAKTSRELSEYFQVRGVAMLWNQKAKH